MYDPGNGQLRYLIHFSDGGSGMRSRDDPLEPGVELVAGGGRYRVVVSSRRRTRRRGRAKAHKRRVGHGGSDCSLLA